MRRFMFAVLTILGFARLVEAGETTVAKFEMQEIAKDLGVGYAVTLVDVNHDGKKDIVVVDTTRVVWYENPTWKRHTILQGVTKADNVCIDAHDIDGDGLIDFALGADWKPFNTKTGGTLQWLKRGKTLEEPWSVYPIDMEPTVHRIRFADIDGSGKSALVSSPLMGRNATKEKNWMDGSPVRVTAYQIPKDPTRDRWTPTILNETLHVMHNIWPIPSKNGKRMDLLCASYEGVNLLSTDSTGKWSARHLGEGNQANLQGNRGASEIKMGTHRSGKKFIATIEPWHGNQVVVYSEPREPSAMWDRKVIDEELRWGHGVWVADLDGDGGEELIIGVRDEPAATDKFKIRRGVRVYKVDDGFTTRWSRQLVDNGGVAVEDLARIWMAMAESISSRWRQTHNVRIYWNKK